jgi:SAM-dependent methyltransferase
VFEHNRRNLALALQSSDYSSAVLWSGKSGEIFYACDDHAYSLDFLLRDDIYYRSPILSALLDLLSSAPIRSVVDCGCGLGHCSAFVKSNSSRLNVSGFDPSPVAVAKANHLYRDLPITFHVDSLDPCSFVFDSNVAYLFMMVFMYFTPSQLNALAVSAKSSPGSILAITEPLPSSPTQFGGPHSLSSFYHDIDRIFPSVSFEVIYAYDVPACILGNASGVGVCHRIYRVKSE